MDLQDLQQHAQSANERLLMVKLLEASRIIEEQEAVRAQVVARFWPTFLWTTAKQPLGIGILTIWKLYAARCALHSFVRGERASYLPHEVWPLQSGTCSRLANASDAQPFTLFRSEERQKDAVEGKADKIKHKSSMHLLL